MSAMSPEDIRARYERALAALLERLKKDRTVLAAVLGGSLSHDEVWEKSDIDLVLIGDESHKERTFCLVEDGVNIHAIVTPRSAFKKIVEGSLQGSFFHSFLSRSRLLYTNDESLSYLFEGMQRIGDRDRSIQLFNFASQILPVLDKAEKWLRVKRDTRYALLWTLFCVEGLAKVLVISTGEVVGREAIQQALRRDPELFGKLYIDLIDGPKDEATIGAAIATVQDYLRRNVDEIFGAVFEFLSEAGGPRSMSEIKDHFHKAAPGAKADFACEWLSDHGYIDKVEAPLRLSEKSRVTVNEAAYYYGG